MKNFFRLIAVSAAVLITATMCSSRQEVLIICTSESTMTENEALAELLDDGTRNVRLMSINDFVALAPKEISASLNSTDVVVCHRPDSSDFSTAEIELGDLLLPWVKQGGELFLTMDAVRLLNAWEVEPQRLEVEYEEAVDGGFGRAVGFHGYREHPIYEDLLGGAYVWNGKVDNMARNIGFSGENLPQAEGAEVLGINWAYIHYHEGRKLVWLTPLGKGRILAAGGYLYYAEPNVNRTTLEIFTRNAVDFLAGSGRFQSKPMHWPFDSLATAQLDYDLAVKTLPSGPYETPSYEKVPCGVRDASAGNFFNVSGEQVMAAARENAGIEEIWIHPVMVMRDASVGVKLKGEDAIRWDKSFPAKVVRTPYFTERTYVLDGGTLSEMIVASPSEPLLTVRYRWDDPDIEQIYVKYTSNLRLMWPYSLESTGTLFYESSPDGSVFSIFDRPRALNMVSAFDRAPQSHVCEADSPRAKHVSVLCAFDAAPGCLTHYISGGEAGIDRSCASVASVMGQPKKVLDAAKKHYDNFDTGLLDIVTDDESFNAAYRWAMVSTDKFYCHTPSIGKSMMSGYWGTSRGWNGGHAVSGRPGYAWYFGRDTEMTGMALNDMGDFGKVREILVTFGRFQSPDGKVYHELTTSGSAHYDASDATPLYLVLAGDYLRKTGDTRFIRQQWPNLMKALDFCHSTDTDGDHLIENTQVGHGWQECGELFGAHTEVYLATLWAQALKECAFMADVLGDSSISEKCSAEAAIVIDKINNEFWNEELKCFNHGLMADGTYQEQKCVLCGTPSMFGIAEPAKGAATAANFSDKYYSTDWGVRMVGYDSPYYALGGYNYGNIWPFHTGCAALAEYRAGLRYQGLRHAWSSLMLYDLWDYGNIAEVVLGDKLAFTGICPHQQWSSSMNLLPLYEGMLGMNVDALAHTFALAPAFPPDFGSVRASHIPAGGSKVTLEYRRTEDLYSYALISEDGKPVSVDFAAVLPLATVVEKVCVDGREVEFTACAEAQNVKVSIAPLKAGKKSVSIDLHCRGGIGVLMNFQKMERGEPDSGLRICSESYCTETGEYALAMAGYPGKSYVIDIMSSADPVSVEGAQLEGRPASDCIRLRVDIPESAEFIADHCVRVRL